MGIPNLPKKLPSRNWMIFWAVLGTFSAAVVYDKREKRRATARWARSVAHLAREPLSSPNQMPRRLTVFLEAPPGDGLRVAQDHFAEYVKPILAASGLDWEFVQGRKEGDVRAAVAERIRRTRQPPQEQKHQQQKEGEEPPVLTQEEILREVRARNGTPEWEGVRGDIIVGRHTWKEYVRGLHEGWLGPLTAPTPPEPEVKTAPAEGNSSDGGGGGDEESKPAEEKQEKKEEEKETPKKPERPPQPPPYNTPADYASAALPATTPTELGPAAPIPFPHILGFSNTPTRLARFLNRRRLADDIGREVAAACLAAAREFRREADGEELATTLDHEERDWGKWVWKDAAEAEEKREQEDLQRPQRLEEYSGEDAGNNSNNGNSGEKTAAMTKKEFIWAKPLVVDPRLRERMRRFELAAADAERAARIAVPEEEVEGWIKGGARALWRWATTKPEPRPNWVADDE